MKRLFFLMLIANAVTIFNLSSCKKESAAPVPVLWPNESVHSAPLIIDLVADQWVNFGDGVYRNNFRDVFPNGLIIGNSPLVEVFLVDNGQETEINNFKIIFKGHELWATYSLTDITLNYNRKDEPLPFRSLNIKVVVN